MRIVTRLLTPIKNRRGFTLTELAIVLGIMGTILGAIWTATSHVYTNQKITKTAQEVLTLAQGIRSMYANKVAIDTGDLTQLAINANLYPSDMLQSSACTGTPPQNVMTTGSCPLDPFNGEMSVNNSTSQAFPPVPSATNEFNIYLWGLGSSNCAAVLSAIIPQAVAGGGLIGMYSDTHGALSLTATTSLTDAHIQGCGGNIVLIFSL
jgi:prepilin-type N-terminal cleavage/methylation domain-containing protein